MGLLDKALGLKSSGIKQIKKKTEKSVMPKSNLPKSKLLTDKSKSSKLKSIKAAEDSPNISLSTGRIQVGQKNLPLPDFVKLSKSINHSLKTQNSGLDFAHVKESIQKKLTERKKASALAASDISRVATGIPGLDEVIEGGLIKNSCNLIGGGAGSGKSIFCMQFLVHGIEKNNETGIFITFEEEPDEIIEEFSRFGWELEKKINDKKLVILHFTPEEVNKFLESGGGIVRDTIESVGAKRVVIDSLTAFTLLFKDELAARKAVLSLFESMAKWGVTTLLTSEQEPNPEQHQSTLMEFEVDGVVLLYNVRKGDVRERSLEVFKMRATQHSAKIFPMKIENDGITIYPEESIF